MKKQFWKKIIESFNIFRYKELSKTEIKESFAYFITLFSIMSAIALLLLIPSLIKMPQTIQGELEKADEFTINITIESESALNFPTTNPLFSVVNNKSEGEGLLIFTKTELVYNILPFFKPSTSIDTYSNIKENSEDASSLAIILIILIAPSLIVYAYLFHILKYLIIAIVLASITKLIVSIMQKKIKYKKLLTATFYSLTPLIIIELLLLPFSIQTFFIPIILYIIWYIIISIELIEEF
ncbi:MAG: DUF1189 family protein [Candidatus Woesearchaeota archaeon]